MSIFEAISIQGIRSFDPNNSQVLEFFKPVTIILGQNGSGKTTIIESLKYATTGDFPPGSKVGGSFVHDPKIARESEIKAKISLEIKDLRGNSLNVSRSLKATQKDKNKQVTLQTLDSSIKRTSANGETVSISSKCADINLEMTNSLGVSKAVLENVIFCHQEESNWPLMEGKAVKQRFDDLFASTRYVKALDSIRKTKMEKDTEVKQFKVELKYLKSNRDEADKKSSQKRTQECLIATFNSTIEDIQKKLEPVEASIRNFQQQISQLNQVESDLKIKVNEKISKERRIKELSDNISEPLNNSVEELETMINDSGREMERLKTEIDKIEDQIRELKSEKVNMSRNNDHMLVEKGGLSTKLEVHKSQQDQFYKALEQISSELNIEYNQSSATRTMRNIQDHIDKEEEMLNEKMNTADQEIKGKQKILDEKVAEKTTLEHDINTNRITLKRKRNELIQLEKRIGGIGEDSNKLNAINKNLSDLKEELETFKGNFSSEEAKKDISTNYSEVTRLEERVHDTEQELSMVQALEAKFKDINFQKQQINDKDKEAKRLRRCHLESLNAIFDNDIPKSNVTSLLKDRFSKWQTKSLSCQQGLLRSQSQLASLTADDRQLRMKIDEKTELVKKFEDNVLKICGNLELSQTLLKFKKKKVDLEEEIATVQGNVSLYKKFKSMLITNGSDCPLCHRDFCNTYESASLIDEITEKINFVPDLDKKASELSRTSDQFEELLKLESLADEIHELKTSMIENLVKEAQSKRNEISSVNSIIEEVTKEQEACKQLEARCNLVQADVAMMEKLIQEIKVHETSLRALEEQMTMTHDQFQQKVSELRSTKGSLQTDLCNKKKELEEQRRLYEKKVNKENQLKTKMNDLEKQRIDIQSGQQEWSSLCSKKEELVSEVDYYDKNIQSNESTLAPIINTISLLKKDQVRSHEERKMMEKGSREKTEALKSKLRSLETILSTIKRFEKDNVQETLSDLERRMQKNSRDINQSNECISEMESAIARYKSSISNNKIKNKEMVDTVRIRHCQSEIDLLHEAISVLKIQLGGENLSSMCSQLTKLDNDRSRLKKEFDDVNFQKNNAVSQVNFLEEELSNRFLNAEPSFLDMLCKIKVIEIAIVDLEKYYKALDQAIMNHHKTKMMEINKILKELWRNTYSGKDIDFVEICSDEESSSAGSKRRNYNYRVVMVKSGIRLDMRGRCSAGQKVLASLLIRLALAEVFCLHCGVLSLDEPTTNLDQENIENLAYALVKIIKNRSKQKNFQLILITHDEDFLQLLSRSDFVDEFYKIRCNARGHSEIQRTRIDHR